MLTHLLAPVLRRPLLCLALLWVAGTALAVHLALPWGTWAGLAALALLAWGVVAGLRRPGGSALLCGAVLCLAAALAAWRLAPPALDDPRALPAGTLTLRGYPVAAPTATARGSWHVPFRLVARRVGDHWVPAAGTIYLAGRTAPPQVGRWWEVRGRVRPPDLPGNPFGFSWRAYLVERNLTGSMWAYALAPRPEPAPTTRLAATRAYLSRRLAATMPASFDSLYAHLLESLVLGVHNAPVAPELVEQFRRAGTIHLMVVSGSQITLLGAVLLFPLWLTTAGRGLTTYPRLRVRLLLLSLPILGLYVVLADRGPSVDRALLMGLLATLAILLAVSPLARRRAFQADGLTLLAAAALVILISNPATLFGPSMQLSFAAVFGLLTVTPVLMRALHRWLGPLTLVVAATVGAQIMTMPVLAWHFGAIPLLAPLTNLLAVPLVALLLPLGLLTLLLAMAVPPAAVLLNYLNVLLLKLLIWISATAAAAPFATAPWVVRSPWVVLGYLVLVGAAILALSRWADRQAQDWSIPAGREPVLW